MQFKFKRNSNLAKKISLLLALVIAGGMVFTGCYGATQPKGWSGAAVSGDRLFAGTLDGRLVALAPANGTPLWSDPEAGTLGTTKTAIYGSPAVGDEFVYVAGYNGKVYAFLPSTGSLRWIYPREGNLMPIVGGMMLSQGKILFGNADGMVYALDAVTGDRLWSAETGDKIWVTPTVAGDILYVSSFDQKLYALNIADGSERWTYESEQILTTSPLIDNGTIYIGSFDRYMYALDAGTGSLKWQSGVRGGKWFWAKPVIQGGVLYAPNLDGKVYLFDTATGAEMAGAIDLGSPISSSPVAAGNKVIFATEDGIVYPVDSVSFEKGASLIDVKTEIGSVAKNTSRKIYAPLSASGDTVYVKAQSTSEDVLFAVDVTNQTVLWGRLLIKE